MAIKIRALADLRAHEPDVLAAIRAAKDGGRLFLVDPLRFLRDHGFDVGADVEHELIRAQPHYREKIAPADYDRIRASDPTQAGVRITIATLGLPTGRMS